MGLLTNRAAALRETVLQSGGRGEELTTALLSQFDELHSQDIFDDIEIERLLLRQRNQEMTRLEDRRKSGKRDLVRFNPSGASKCDRELFYRALRVKQDDMTMFPFQRRWVRNSTAVHEAVQRDLLYSEKYTRNPSFTVERTPEGLPAWEGNILTTKKKCYNGTCFEIHGMMDGILRYRDGSRIGFEFKTKSTTIAQVGNYKMKTAEESHRLQTVAYSLLFGIEEFFILYESVAKDSWMKGAAAKDDLRCFYIRVTEQEREDLISKWARVAEQCYNGEIPDGDFTKCIFCPFKSRCHGVANAA